MLRVGYFAANTGEIPVHLRWPSEQLMFNCGQNLGNLVFWHAVRRMFDDPVTMIGWDSNPEDFRGTVDRLVIPAANYLNPRWDFGPQAALVEALDCPVAIFGLGAQSEHETEAMDLPAGSVRFLQVVAERAGTIFVRGDTTAELCARYGVTNVAPLGCPSITLSDDPFLGRRLDALAGTELTALYSAGGTLKGNTQEVEAKLFAMCCAIPESSYIIQEPRELVELAADMPMTRRGVVTAMTVHRFMDPEASFQGFRRDLRRVTHWFADMPEWLRFAARHSHSVSTRMHGAIMSIMAGVPTVVLAHDSRIRELCRTMRLPHIDPAEASRILPNVGALFDAVPFDAAAFDARRQEIAGSYRAYLSGIGLSPSATLSALAGAAVPAG
jgi:hypothetical protein